MLESRPMVTEPTMTVPGAIQASGWIEGVATPVLADPVPADPVLADPAPADPVLADPVLADPALADPALGWAGSGGGPSEPMSGACDGPADGSVSSASCSAPGPVATFRSSQIA